MHSNLSKIVNNLSPTCHIYNGHEYTEANLKWGITVEPENKKLKEYLEYSSHEPCTLPTTIEREKEVNVFLRSVTGSPVQESLTPDKVEYLRILREAKN